jgi:hypothetical protein
MFAPAGRGLRREPDQADLASGAVSIWPASIGATVPESTALE